ncbi:MAG: radical SAM protein [Desulfosarcinaceae bacterium]|nr:radical SAM protein [Desulfosarcinaceae bacterium]
MGKLSLTRLISGGVITNYHCVSRCGHCLYNSGPHRSKDYLDTRAAESIFETIGRHGCGAIHIGGGEPFLAPEKLLAVVQTAGRCGMAIDYVETNAAWCTRIDAAVDLLGSLREAGLETLLLSISPFHNAFIPFQRVRDLIAACRLAGVRVFPWVNAFVRDIDRLGADRPHGMTEFEAAFGPGYLAAIPDRYWIHLGGRALETFRPLHPVHTVEEILAIGPRSCARTLADTAHFHIDLYGSYIPGLCSGLAIAMSDLGGPLPEGKYPLIDQLNENGIRGLYGLACRRHGYLPKPTGYLSHCDLCDDIRRFLQKRHSDRYPELAPEGFYW